MEELVLKVLAKWIDENERSYESLKKIAITELQKNDNISKKQFWMGIREKLTGKKEGIGVAILIKHLSKKEIAKRIGLLHKMTSITFA